MPVYSCHNEPKYGTVPKAILAQLPAEGSGRATPFSESSPRNKCPNCRTSTAAGTLALLRKMLEPQYRAAESPERVMEFLFHRAAAQRKSATNGYRDHWSEIAAAWALACVRLVGPAPLQGLCAAIRIRWGSGLERQALQALGAGLMRDAGVDEHLRTAAHAGPMAVTYNACVDLLLDLLARAESFRQLESLRRSVAGVRELRDATVAACALLDDTLAACGNRRPGTAGR